MKIYSETSLGNFNFWSGAKDNAKELTLDQLGEIESQLEDIYPDGMDETALNDFFWFDFSTVKEWLGIEQEDEQ